jgi:hypothetical protein
MKTIRLIEDAVKAILEEPLSWAHNESDILIPKRIADRITLDKATGCWRVGGWNTGNGFANISICGRTVKVHRVIYAFLVGPIPDGHVLDHKKSVCPNRDCCNPDHLEPVTVQVNTERGTAILFKSKAA